MHGTIGTLNFLFINYSVVIFLLGSNCMCVRTERQSETERIHIHHIVLSMCTLINVFNHK